MSGDEQGKASYMRPVVAAAAGEAQVEEVSIPQTGAAAAGNPDLPRQATPVEVLAQEPLPMPEPQSLEAAAEGAGVSAEGAAAAPAVVVPEQDDFAVVSATPSPVQPGEQPQALDTPSEQAQAAAPSAEVTDFQNPGASDA